MKRGHVVGAIVIGLCALTAAFSLRGAATANVNFDEAQVSRETCQVYGKLLKESVRMDRKMTRVRFQLEEEKTRKRLDVLYDRPQEAVAANFTAASHVRAVGLFDRQAKTFRAARLYTKCPSKYVSEGYSPQKSSAPATPR